MLCLFFFLLPLLPLFKVLAWCSSVVPTLQTKKLVSQLEDAQGLIISREETIEKLSGTISEMQAEKEQTDTAHDSVREELACSKANTLALERDFGQKLEEARVTYEAVTDQLRNVRRMVLVQLVERGFR